MIQTQTPLGQTHFPGSDRAVSSKQNITAVPQPILDHV